MAYEVRGQEQIAVVVKQASARAMTTLAAAGGTATPCGGYPRLWGSALDFGPTGRILAANSPIQKKSRTSSNNSTHSDPKHNIPSGSHTWHGNRQYSEGAHHLRPRNAFVHSPQHACCVATPLRPLQNLRNHTEYVRRMMSWSEPSMYSFATQLD